MIKTIIMRPYLVLNTAKAFMSLVMMAGILFPHPNIVLALDSEPMSDSFVLEKIEKLTKCGIDKASYGVARKMKGLITAYSSRVEETDDRPFEAASGKTVYDGMVANNKFPFGTKIRIPELYGDKVLTVDDRMNSRKWGNQFDVWYDNYPEAKKFGAKFGIVIEILES